MAYPLPGTDYVSSGPNFEFSVVSTAHVVPSPSRVPNNLAYGHANSSGNFDAGSQSVDSQWCSNSMYRHGEARSYHSDFEDQNRCQVNISGYCTQSTHASLPLHAPVPLHGHFPGLDSTIDGADSVATSEQISTNTRRPFSSPDATPLHLNYDYTDAPIPGSFPTPSELLAELSSRESVITDEQLGLDAGPETARKARRRAMAKSVGFVPTDPDTISSHDKKRHYLECLELYVTYLHQQLSIVGAPPVPLERIQNYRGLSSRSIRTLLVHMENTTRKLNLQIQKEEQRFANLREAAYQRCSDVGQMSGSSSV
ncbi:hypothetical protein BDQ17DRAFT_1418326 [Cyathus striatus]|nr:hypothetical protein BDQ17DRAFT_1418326 [Cyathus striatus]